MQAVLAQLVPVPGDARANAARAANVVAAHPDADLVVFPELFLSGYDLARARETAIDLEGVELAKVRAAAEALGTAVIVGFGERRGRAVATRWPASTRAATSWPCTASSACSGPRRTSSRPVTSS